MSQFRLVDMYTSCTDEATESMIVQKFTRPSQLRIVIATVAFGMGIDCPDVHDIFHLGPPGDVESYIQETGRAGRNGMVAYATLLKTKNWKRYIDDEYMISYLENEDVCRRKVLFCHMEGYHTVEGIVKCLCCDVCQKSCQCSVCMHNQKKIDLKIIL